MTRLTPRWASSRLVALMVGVVTVSACESGPQGPGDWNATVESSRRIAGAVVIDVRGVGVQGFKTALPLQVFWSPPAVDGSYRVVLVNPGAAAPLTFEIQVDDVSADPPTGVVVEATALTNLPLRDPSDFAVLIQP